ncbi:MAG: ATP-binding protein [bacterium]|nr:ATP-binding protein [bacterium]
MSRRRKYTAVHREGLRVVSRMLREAVWKMGSPDDYPDVLATLTEGFRSLRISFDGCGIYLIDCAAEPAVVTGQYILQHERWKQALPAHDRDAAVAIWQEGAATYAEDVHRDAPALESPLHLRFGHEVRSVVDVPFANGVLTVACRQAEGFSSRDIEMLWELAEGLPALFNRMEDLRQLELRDRLVERAQRLELTGQLAAGTVHEVNNALTAILGHCELLLMEELDAATRESLELILRAGDSARIMVGHFLTMARGQEPERQTTDLNLLVHDCLQLLRRQLARERVELIERLDPHLPLVFVQASQIQQIVLNLVQNSRHAVLASSDGGRIEVRTHVVDDVVRLSLSDNGPGVPVKLRDRIFEPFFTTKENGKGTGLGLTVCRTIATSHGGDLRIQNLDDGSCFVLELPAADKKARRALN